MKLLLTSSGITNKSIEKALLKLLGKPFKDCNLTFIPTAANVEEGVKDWLTNDMNNFKKLGLKSFKIVDISKDPKDVWLPIFKDADILAFGGGNSRYLLDWIKKSGLDEMFSELLKTKVYVGISAGSRAPTRGLVLSHNGTKDDVGLEIVNLSIVPHINSIHFPERTFERVEKESKGIPNPVYALDDNSAVLVDDKEISVVSEGKWKKFN